MRVRSNVISPTLFVVRGTLLDWGSFFSNKAQIVLKLMRHALSIALWVDSKMFKGLSQFGVRQRHDEQPNEKDKFPRFVSHFIPIGFKYLKYLWFLGFNDDPDVYLVVPLNNISPLYT